MQTRRFFYDADPAGSGGGLPPSLADILDPKSPGDTPPAGTPPADPPADPVEGLDPEGNLLEGYERLEDGTIQKIADPNEPVKEGEEDEDEVTPEKFFEKVVEITGKPVEVEYGDVDPLSPEGVALREEAIRNDTVYSYDEYLKTNFPRAYAYFLHTQKGGDDADFFSTREPALPSREEFEESHEAQANWVMRSLIAKDVPKEVAEATVAQYVKDGKLKDVAMGLYDKQVSEDRKRLKAMEDDNKQRQIDFENSVARVAQSINETIKSGMKLGIPPAQQASFSKYVMDHLQHDGKDFVVVQPVKEDLGKVLDGLLISFLNGNLSNIIEKKAQTKTAYRLGTRVKADASQSSAKRDAQQQPQFIPLSEIRLS